MILWFDCIFLLVLYKLTHGYWQPAGSSAEMAGTAGLSCPGLHPIMVVSGFQLGPASVHDDLTKPQFSGIFADVPLTKATQTQGLCGKGLYTRVWKSASVIQWGPCCYALPCPLPGLYCHFFLSLFIENIFIFFPVVMILCYYRDAFFFDDYSSFILFF